MKPRLVGSREPGDSPALRVGWPGVIRELTFAERMEAERDWNRRYAETMRSAGYLPPTNGAES